MLVGEGWLDLFLFIYFLRGGEGRGKRRRGGRRKAGGGGSSWY